MASTFDRIFGSNPGPVSGSSAAPVSSTSSSIPTHPAIAPPAGLSSGSAALAADRGATRMSLSKTHSLMKREQWQTPLPLNTETDFSLNTRDIAGASPSKRPILATSETAHTTFARTKRHTNALEPLYVLPSPKRLGTDHSAASPSDKASSPKVSRILTTEDIPGATPKQRIGGGHQHLPGYSTDKFNIQDVTARRTLGLNVPPSGSLNTSDIGGATSPSRIRAFIPSANAGTLNNADIEGATNQAGHKSNMGVFPSYSGPKFHFNQQPRKTAIQTISSNSVGKQAPHFSGF